VQNPLAWVLALMALALAAFKREQQHGWMLDRIENDAGETARKDKATPVGVPRARASE